MHTDFSVVLRSMWCTSLWFYLYLRFVNIYTEIYRGGCNINNMLTMWKTDSTVKALYWYKVWNRKSILKANGSPLFANMHVFQDFKIYKMYKPIVNGGCCLGVKTTLYDGYNTLKRDLMYEAAFRTISDCKSLPSLPQLSVQSSAHPVH